jgi:hypothetical protein
MKLFKWIISKVWSMPIVVPVRLTPDEKADREKEAMRRKVQVAKARVATLGDEVDIKLRRGAEPGASPQEQPQGSQ